MSKDVAREAAYRYTYMRDAGHTDFIDKSRKCEDFFANVQWNKADLAKLAHHRRPALTINKILNTVSNVVGEQLFNRSMVSYRPAKDGTSEIADALTKVFMQISQNNRLPWVRTNVFLDGIITGRGYYDTRLDFTDSLMGEVRVSNIAPNSVLLDPDANQYDRKDWQDVMVTRWLALNDIGLLYGADKQKLLKTLPENYSPYDGLDQGDWVMDRFANATAYDQMQMQSYYPADYNGMDMRRIRVLDRQYKELALLEYFVDMVTGDMREVPSTWERERITQFLETNPTLGTIKKRGYKYRWTVTAGEVELHNEDSPYNHFTIIPYFPHFRRGRTIGIVENLIGPQELLNKVRSQELHVLNTTANSGWKVKQGALKNMDEEDLPERGAETGFVAVVDDMDGLEKITPNQIPSGLDRIGFKAEEDIKNISGVSDYQTGFAREDVSGKASQFNQARGTTNLAPVLDNLNRTDTMLADDVLSMVQKFYTEPRLLHITGSSLGSDDQQVQINEITPEGQIVNDLTIGEYAVVVTSEPERDNFEDTQFDQALRLKTEVGIDIPDEVLIETSKLRNKAEILATMSGNKTPEQQQFEEELQRRNATADLELKEAKAANEKADAKLKTVRAAKEHIDTQQSIIEDKSDISPEKAIEMKLKAYEITLKDKAEERKQILDHVNNMKEIRLKATTAKSTASNTTGAARNDH
jgi:hypothetical protein